MESSLLLLSNISSSHPSGSSTNAPSTDASNKNSTHCKPLTILQPDKACQQRLLFGNDTFYLFVRYFQLCYERVEQAKALAFKPSESMAWLRDENSQPEPADQKYSHFLRNLEGFISQTIDQEVYEDLCRNAFGIDSYVLFTMDKLVYLLGKQVQSIIGDETCQQLLRQFSYELARVNGSVEPIYHSNALKILKGSRCFRFELDQNTGDFSIRILESHKSYNNAAGDKTPWSQYVNQFVLGSKPDPNFLPSSQVFLKRNYRNTMDKFADNLFSSVEVYNDLECKINPKSYKTKYVDHTEDYFYRRGKKRGSGHVENNNNLPSRKRRKLEDILTKKNDNNNNVERQENL